jgi:hypothetical protein
MKETDGGIGGGVKNKNKKNEQKGKRLLDGMSWKNK